MKRYTPYSPQMPRTVSAEKHVIADGKIRLDHIPYLNSISISGFRQTDSMTPAQGYFFCAYGDELYYRESNCLVLFNSDDNGKTVSVDYLEVGTIVTFDDMNEIAEHMDDTDLHHERYELPTAGGLTKGGVRVGAGLKMTGDVLSCTLQGGLSEIPTASSSTKGGIKVGLGLSMNGETLNNDYNLPTASTTQKGGIKVGDGLEMSGEKLRVALGTSALTYEGAMWISD